MFWENYVNACAHKGVSPTGAMKQMGISTGNIHRWQSGGHPTGEMLIALTKYFGCSADYLLLGKEYGDQNERIIRDDKEYHLIKEFRALPDLLQDQIISYSKGLADANRIMSRG